MRTLTFRLTLWYACVVTATVSLILLAGRFYLEQNLMRGVDFLNDAEFEEIQQRLQAIPADLDPQAIADLIRQHTEIDASLFFFQVGSGDNPAFFRSSNLGGQILPVGPGERATIRDLRLGHLRIGTYSLGGLDISIASSLQSVDAIFSNAGQTIALILALVFLVSIGIGILLSRIALKPVKDIQAIARRISARNLSERIPVPPGGDELSRLSQFLNEMFDRLEGAFQQISRFTADASHELRTPLSLIRLHGERLLRDPDLPVEERLAALGEQMGEIEHLNKLIDDLLFIARADAGVLQLSTRQTAIGAYVADFAEDARILCEDQHVGFELDSAGDGHTVTLDPVWIRHVLLNLLSNALRVSPAGSTIRMRSQPLPPNHWRLELEDEGPGLPEAMTERIFDRFQRHVDPSADGAGSGLGLAICRSIVAKHGGQIRAFVRTDRSGLRLQVDLPTCKTVA
jgi:signal transduction histidine kinase